MFNVLKDMFDGNKSKIDGKYTCNENIHCKSIDCILTCAIWMVYVIYSSINHLYTTLAARTLANYLFSDFAKCVVIAFYLLLTMCIYSQVIKIIRKYCN